MAFERKLTPEIQTFIVTQLACFDGPVAIAAAVKAEFDVEVSKQLVETYNPTKRSGRNVSAKLRAIFDETRKRFLESTADMGISHRAVRLRILERMIERAEAEQRPRLVGSLLRQAAEEMGGVYTNRRELTGKEGTPLQVVINGSGGDADL